MATISEALASALRFHKAGQLQRAEQIYQQILQIQPHHADALHLLGVVAHQAGKDEIAVDYISRALIVHPNQAVFHSNLGAAYQGLGKLEEAVACYQRAVQLKPDYAEAYYNLGTALKDQDKGEQAVAAYRRALEIFPEYAEALNNLGCTLRELGEFEEAVDYHRKAVQIKPDFAEGHYNLGMALLELGMPEAAVASHRRAVELMPDSAKAHAGLAIPLLLNGELAEGWRHYEWRLQCEGGAVSPQCQPRWDGSPLDGRTIMLFSEQGLGDTLQFVRYAPLVKQRGATVYLECQTALAGLLASCPGIDQICARGSALPPFDVAAPLLSLPSIFGTALDGIPATVPYLKAEEDLVERWGTELRGIEGFKVGIAWQGTKGYRQDRWRSVRLAEFDPLARVDGVRLISLQKGPGTEQLKEVLERFPVVNLGPGLDEDSGPFMDTAAVIKNLDLVVCCDTVISHLAGALGVPVWVALPFVPHWPWLLGRDDSPWYPTARLFRQTWWGKWHEVFLRMASALEAETASAGAAEALHVPISPGELIDKITILEIKIERISDPAKRINVRSELEALVEVRDEAIRPSPELDRLTSELKAVNENLWQIEDGVRQCERQKDFGRRFIDLARSVYLNNDRRSDLKRQINELLKSKFGEEKSYAPYR